MTPHSSLNKTPEIFGIKQFIEHLIFNERLVCVLPRRHPLVRRSRISLGQLAGEKIIVFSREYAAYNYDFISALLKPHNIEPYGGYKLRNWFTVIAPVSQGMGVALVPHFLSGSYLGDVVYREIAGIPVQQPIAMIWQDRPQKNKPMDKGVQAFIDFIRLNGLPVPQLF